MGLVLWFAEVGFFTLPAGSNGGIRSPKLRVQRDGIERTNCLCLLDIGSDTWHILRVNYIRCAMQTFKFCQYPDSGFISIVASFPASFL